MAYNDPDEQEERSIDRFSKSVDKFIIERWMMGTLPAQICPACPECGAYSGHCWNCSLISFEEAKKQLLVYGKMYSDEAHDHRNAYENLKKALFQKLLRITAERDKWRGKFDTVRQENNKLRKKL